MLERCQDHGVEAKGKTRLFEEFQQGSKSLTSQDKQERSWGEQVSTPLAPWPLSLYRSCRGPFLSSSQPVARLSFPYIELNYDQERKYAEFLLARKQEEACSQGHLEPEGWPLAWIPQLQ